MPDKPDVHSLLRDRRPTLPRELAARLKLLALTRETEAARAEIEAALACRWWGLRVLAIQAIGRWGGARNRDWLTRLARRPLARHRHIAGLRHGDPLRWSQQETVAARVAICGLVDETDAEWVLDLWFDDVELFSGLHDALLSRLPGRSLEARLMREIGGSDRSRLEAALWLAFNRRDLGGREIVFHKLAASRDDHIAKLARRLALMDARRDGGA